MNDDLCRGGQSGSCAHADLDPAPAVRVTSGPVLGANIYGLEAIGWRQAATLPMRSGNNTLRTRNPRSRMITSRSCRLIGPLGRSIRLLAVTRSHRL